MKLDSKFNLKSIKILQDINNFDISNSCEIKDIEQKFVSIGNIKLVFKERTPSRKH